MVLILSDRISISQKIESNAEKNYLEKLVKSIRPKGLEDNKNWVLTTKSQGTRCGFTTTTKQMEEFV